MLPTGEQVQTAAYHRWRQRGGAHGFDRHDWLAAEDELVFRLNYRIVERRKIDEPMRDPGRDEAGRCRFCERTEREAAFGAARAKLAGLGWMAGVFAGVECDECASAAEADAGEFARFSRPFRAVSRVRGLASWPVYRWDGRWASDGRGGATLRLDRPDGTCAVWHRSEPYLPLAALKFLTRMALATVGEEGLEEFGGALEWVSNPDHRLDSRAFGGLGCRVYLAPGRFEAPWVSLARRVDDGAALPSTLFFLGVGHALFQVAVPLATRDEDHDGESLRIPAVSLPGDTAGPPWESPWFDVPLDTAEGRHGASLELVYCGGAAGGV